MKKYLFLTTVRNFLRAGLILTMLIFTFAPISTTPAYALPPSNDAWQNATNLATLGIPSTYTINTVDAQQEGDEPVLLLAIGGCNGIPLRAGLATVWFVYTAPSTALLSLDTLGSTTSKPNPETPGLNYDYDTYIAVWTGGNVATNTPPSSLVVCNDDTETGRQSQLAFNAVAGTTYWIQVAQYNGRLDRTYVEQPYKGGSLRFHVGFASQTEVYVHGQIQGNYTIFSNAGVRVSYSADNGPVRIYSSNNVPIIGSERILLKTLPNYLSYSEFMGVPASKLSDTYLFPWYNNATAGGLNSQLRFANVGNAATTVTIKIAGVTQPTSYPLAPNQSQRVTLDNVDNGPVEVKSSGGVLIVASMRVNLKKLPSFSSYTELMGLSASSTPGTKYLFPWYNNATNGGLDSQLRFGNVGSSPTTVTITVGGITQPTSYNLAPNQSQRVSLTNVDNGPVEVASSGNVPIIVSQRINLKPLPTFSSYSELMGLPGAVLTETRYLFPWYNNLLAGGVESQLRFGNVGVAATTVTIKIAGVAQPLTYNLAPSESARVTLDNVDNGPVEVSSSGGVPIIASMRVNLKPNPTYSSYAEFMGLSIGSPVGFPGNELSNTYWLPWYNNVSTGGLDTQLRFGAP